MSLRSSIEHYRTLRQAPIWKLLASDNGPQAIAILQTLLYDNERVLPASVFFERLRNAYAEGLEETLSRDEARTLALRWVSDGYLICRLPAGAQEETFELTAAGADAIRLLSRFDSKRLGPTESRLEMLTHALARLATESDHNQQNRIELLEAEKMRIDQEIDAIRTGRKPAITPEAALQRIAEILELYAELQGDFRRVREEFERLNRSLRAEIMQSEDTRGVVLDRFFEGYDVIGESAAGQAFEAFYRMLTDNSAHGELEDSLERIASRAFYRKLALADRKKLTGLQEELLVRANETHAVMRLLAVSLKEFVRSQDFVKERHLAELIRETRKLAHEVSKRAGVNDVVWEWDLTSCDIDSLSRLWNTVTGENVSAADFLEHAGLLRLPQFVLVKNAAAWVGEGAAEEVVKLPVQTLAKKAPESPVVLIIENEQTALSLDFPDVPIFLALGYGVTLLANLPWMKEKGILYFGDLDTHGLAILAECRRLFPQTQSVLMDLPTFERWRDFAVTEPKGAALSPEYLTPVERALADVLSEGHLRLEQERIPLDTVRGALLAALAGSVGKKTID